MQLFGQFLCLTGQFPGDPCGFSGCNLNKDGDAAVICIHAVLFFPVSFGGPSDNLFSKSTASTGQTSKHLPHPMQSSGSMTVIPSISISMAPYRTFRHADLAPDTFVRDNFRYVDVSNFPVICLLRPVAYKYLTQNFISKKQVHAASTALPDPVRASKTGPPFLGGARDTSSPTSGALEAEFRGSPSMASASQKVISVSERINKLGREARLWFCEIKLHGTARREGGPG